MALRSKLLALVLTVIVSVFSVIAVDADAQAWRRPYRPPPVVRTPPPRPLPPPRPPVRPTVGSPNVRPGPAIRAPIARPGGIRPTSPGLGGRSNAIAIRPTTLPKPMAGVSRPSGGIAIKQGANVSLKPLTPTGTLMSRLKGSVSRPALAAGSRPALRANTKVIQAKRLTALKRSTAISIQRVRAELSNPGKALAPVRCAAIGKNCGFGEEKVYLQAKGGKYNLGNKWKSLAASSVNQMLSAKYPNPPFDGRPFPNGKPRTVREVSAKKNEVFVRFYDGENTGKIGGWIAREKDIKNMSARDIKSYLALEHLPKYRINVVVPAGTKMYHGKVAPNYGERGNGRQYFLITDIPEDNFLDETIKKLEADE